MSTNVSHGLGMQTWKSKGWLRLITAAWSGVKAGKVQPRFSFCSLCYMHAGTSAPL
jgi:hypothetical protein